MDNTITALSFSSIARANTYFLVGAGLTICAYKISRYVFSGYNESKVKPLVAAAGFVWSAFIIKVIIYADSIQKQTIPIFSYLGGTLTVAFVLAVWLFKDNKSYQNIIHAQKDYQSLRAEDYQSFWSQLHDKNLIFLLGPAGVEKADFIKLFMSRERRSLHMLPPQFNNAQSFFANWEEIKSFCINSKSMLMMHQADWLLEPSNLFYFFNLVAGQSHLKIIVTMEDVDIEALLPNLKSNMAAISIPPPSKEVALTLLTRKYKDISPEDTALLIDSSDFLPQALPGSALQLYDQYLKNKQSRTLKEYILERLDIEPFWLESENRAVLASSMNKAGEQILEKLIGLDDLIAQINALLFEGMQAKHTPSENLPLASVLIAGATGAGKTALAKAMAKYLFRDRLITIKISDFIGEDPAVLRKKFASLKAVPHSVVLIEGVDMLYQPPDNPFNTVNPAITQFLIDVLKGDFKDFKLGKAFFILTAENENKINEALKLNTTIIPIAHTQGSFDKLFTLLYNQAKCNGCTNGEFPSEVQLKGLCPPFDGSVLKVQRFLQQQIVRLSVQERDSSCLIKIDQHHKQERALSNSADGFVIVLSPAPSVQNHAVLRDLQCQQLAKAVQDQRGAILVGPSGSGKTDLIQKMTQSRLQQREIILLNTISLAANTQWMGTFEAHVRELKERITRNNSLLVVEGSHLLLTQRLEFDHFNFAKHLETMIEGGGFSTIVTLTPDEFQQLKLLRPKLISLLTQINLEPLTTVESLDVLKKTKPILQTELKCTFEDKAFETTLQYTPYLKGSLPGSAILFLRSMPVQENEHIDETKVLNKLSQQLNIGLEWLQFGHPELGRKIDNAKLALKTSIHGQDIAIDQICDLIQVRQKKLSSSPTATLGNFLIMGDPGVGKTYFAQLLSQQLFKSNFIRIDMQHLIDPNELIKLTDHRGSLSKLNDHPFSVVLLDEIEKAPREAQDALLGILQAGRFVDKKGYEVRFDHAVIIMTTNASEQSLKRYFTTAFLSRTTSISFNPLSKLALTSIIKDKLEVIKKSCEKYHTSIEFGETEIEHLVKQFITSQKNARDADRFLEEKVSLALAKVLKLNQKLTAKIDVDNIIFEEAR